MKYKKICCLSPYPPVAHPTHAGGAFLRKWVEGLAEYFDVVTIYGRPSGVGPRLAPRGRHSLHRLAQRSGTYARSIARWPRSSSYLPAGANQVPGNRTSAHGGPRGNPMAEHGRRNTVRAVKFSAVTAHVAHDLRSEALLSQAGHLAEPVYAAVAVAKLVRGCPQELRALRSADIIWSFKESDVALTRRFAPRAESKLLMPTLPAISAAGPVVHDARTGHTADLIFVGDLSRRENRASLQRFIAKTWPAIKRHIPHSRLSLVGSGASPKFVSYCTSRDVTVRGWVDDLADAYSGADIAIAPLDYKGGIKFKVAEAIAYGLPVIATPIAAAGYPSQVRDSITVANSTGDWVNAVRGVLSATTTGELTRRSHSRG